MLSETELKLIVDAKMIQRHNRPMPIDGVFRDARRIGGRGPVVPVGTQAQGALGVFDRTHRDDVELVSYTRSPWATLRSDVRRLVQTVCNGRFSAVQSDTLAVTDVNNVGRTLELLRSGASGSTAFMQSLGTAGDQLVMRWGSNSTAATGNDIALTTQVDSFNASTFSRDTALFTDTMSGSKVYAGANTTAREIGFSMSWFENVNNVPRPFLFDHTVIADTAVNTGQTVALSYVTQF